jgi:hypothetical protein
MIILYSKNTTILRVPKTGSTSLEASVRFAPGCMAPGDMATGLDDANLKPRGFPQNLEDYYADTQALRRTIYDKRQEATSTGVPPTFTTEEQAIVDIRATNRLNDEFRSNGLHHSTLNDFIDPLTYGPLNVLTEAQILSFTHYAFIRNPLKRVISAFLFKRYVRDRRTPVGVEQFHADVLNGELKRLVYRDQVDYFKFQGNIIVTPLLFETYVPSVRSLILTLGGTPLNEYPRFKSENRNNLSLIDPQPSVANWITPFPAIKQAIIDRYSEDVALWEATSGLTL